MRKRYILSKDTPEYKKGAIFEEMCDDGTQDFRCINHADFVANESYVKRDTMSYLRKFVTDQPKWFEELVWFNVRQSQVDKVKDFIKSLPKEVKVKKK